MTLVHRTSMTQALCPNNIFPFLNNSSLQIISLLGIQRSTGVVIRPNLSRPCDAWGLGNHRGLNTLLHRERWSSNHNYIYIYIYKLTERIVVLLNAIFLYIDGIVFYVFDEQISCRKRQGNKIENKNHDHAQCWVSKIEYFSPHELSYSAFAASQWWYDDDSIFPPSSPSWPQLCVPHCNPLLITKVACGILSMGL